MLGLKSINLHLFKFKEKNITKVYGSNVYKPVIGGCTLSQCCQLEPFKLCTNPNHKILISLWASVVEILVFDSMGLGSSLSKHIKC